MKKKLLFATGILLLCIASLQAQKDAGKYPRIRVTNWGKKVMIVGPNVWDKNEAEIVKQIGKAEFDSVKAYTGHGKIPVEMSIYDGKGVRNKDSLDAKMDKLVMYKIATFTHVYDGGSDKYAILRVPYAENKNWDPNVKWRTIYISITDADIEEIK